MPPMMTAKKTGPETDARLSLVQCYKMMERAVGMQDDAVDWANATLDKVNDTLAEGQEALEAMKVLLARAGADPDDDE